MNLNKIIKISLWSLILSIVIIYFLFWNIGHDFSKQVESGQVDSISGEGLGMAGVLLFFYFFYLVVFIIWLSILNALKNSTSNISKKAQLILIFIFSIIPTFLIVLFFIIASPNPFKYYEKVKKLEHEIENGKLITYSQDSVKIYEADIVDDKINGKEIRRYESGELASEANYFGGEPEGESNVYYKNGKKKETSIYKTGSVKRQMKWTENGQIIYLFDTDSLYSYRWSDNGQLKELYQNGQLISFRDEAGNRTLTNGNGRVTYWYKDNPNQKSSESIYKNSKVVKETTWSSNGNKSRQDEDIQLSKEESKKLGYDCEFKGAKKMLYYEDGTIRSITYWSTNFKCKNDNGRNYITYEYTKEGKLKDVHF